MFPPDKIELGQKVRLVVENERCSVYKVEDPTGDGLMTCYSLLPGVVLMHCDMHMSRYSSDLRAKTEMFSIDHCRKGRMEGRLSSGAHYYLDAGCTFIHTPAGFEPNIVCPTSHYHGLTLSFFVEEAQASLKALFAGISLDLRRLRDKFCANKPPVLLPQSLVPIALVRPLYEVAQGSDMQSLRLRLMVLLLHLQELDISGVTERPYFYKTQIEKIKAVESYMMANLGEPHTIAGLAARFEFPATTMKICFKSVFGQSISAYLRNQRMNAAARRLRQGTERVADIGAAYGYGNASKFAEAFRACIGETPRAYRNRLQGRQNLSPEESDV